MHYEVRRNPLFSACGLNCGLCPRFYTKGTSRCPGCAGEDFSAVHPACGVLSCCQRRGLEFCFECTEFPCAKYKDADTADSFITHKNQFRDMEKAKRIGIEAYEAELSEKVGILEALLADYDDGRRKSFFCLAVNLLELPDVRAVMGIIASEVDPDAPIKDKAAATAKLIEQMAQERDVVLKLRK